MNFPFSLRPFILLSFLISGMSAFAAHKSHPVTVQNFNMHPAFSFIENKGQLADENGQLLGDIKFYGQEKGVSVYCRVNKLSFVFTKVTEIEEQKKNESRMPSKFKEPAKTTIEASRMDMELANANPDPEIIAEDIQPVKTNYYLAHTGEHRITNVSGFKKLTYRNIYPMIDMVLDCKGSGFEYSFIVHPGGRVEDIKMVWQGNDNKNPVREGKIKYSCALGEINESAPIAYTSGAGISSKEGLKIIDLFSVSSGINIAHSFRVYGYDKTKDLVIDPTLVWGMYYGGKGDDVIRDIAHDSGNLYMAGYTNSTAGIATTGAYDTGYAGNTDACLAKFSGAGSLLWATYYGGANTEQADGVKADTKGNVYITGYTKSTSGISTTGCYQKNNAGDEDCFIAKFSSSGSLVWGTFFGGSVLDFATALCTDTSDNVYITGYTYSNYVLATSGSYQSSISGYWDAFLAKFSSVGRLTWGTYFGGYNYDMGRGVACDDSGNVFITGETYSNYSVSTAGAHQTLNGGNSDAYLAKFDSAGAIKWATFYGGADDDFGYGLATDDSGNVFMTGLANSTTAISSSGAYQYKKNSFEDAYLVKFDHNGVRKWGTYFGGNGTDGGCGVTCDQKRNVYFCGSTTSTTGVSVAGSYQVANGGGQDAFLAKFNPNGKCNWASYYGGSGTDGANAVTGGDSGALYLSGMSSSKSRISTRGAYDSTFAGGVSDGFLTKFSFYIKRPKNVDAALNSMDSATTTLCPGYRTIRLSMTNDGIDTLKSVKISWSMNGIAQPDTTWTGLLETGSTTSVPLRTYRIYDSTYTFLFYSHDPNGVVDSNTGNDTVRIKFSVTAMGGTYTIGGLKPDYDSFSTVVRDLNKRGICGTAVFNIRDGIYKDQISLDSIKGTTPYQNIIFQGLSNDSSKVILTYPSQNKAGKNNYVLQLNGTARATFRKMTFERTGTDSYAVIVNIHGSAVHNQFLNNIFRGVHGAAYNSQSLIYSDRDNDSNNFYKNNLLRYGQNGFYLSGSSYEDHVWIEGNTIDSFSSTGIYLDYPFNPSIYRNNINGPSGITIFDGDEGQIRKNKIICYGSGSGVYMSLTYGPITFADNFISALGGSSRGFNIDNSHQLYLYNNSVYAPLNIACYISYSTYPTLYNNNFVGATSFYYYTSGASSMNYTSDYNNFNGSKNINYTSNYQDYHSFNINPQYFSKYDLHVNNRSIAHKASTLGSVSDDIDGDQRDPSDPDPGADEFSFLKNDLALDSLITPADSSCGKGHTIISARIRNLGSFPATRFYIIFKSVSASTDSVVIPVSQTLLPGKDTFVNTSPTGFLNTSNGGAFTFTAYIKYVSDTNSANDTIRSLLHFKSAPVARFFLQHDKVCLGSSVNVLDSSVNPTGMAASYQYYVHDTGGVKIDSSTAKSPSFAMGVAGAYRLQLSISANGCADTASRLANVYDMPVAGFSMKRYICALDTLRISDTSKNSSSAKYKYYLTDVAGSTKYDSSSSKSPFFVRALSGNYRILQRLRNGGTCGDTVSHFFTINPIPSAIAGSSAPICAGNSAGIGAVSVSGNTYSWTSRPAGYTSGSSSATVSPASTTTYYLNETITATGCSKTDSVTITVNPLPAANVVRDSTICAGSAITIGLSSVSARTYSWTSNPSGYTSASGNPTVSPLGTTTYYLTETIPTTGCSKSDSVTITVNPLPSANAGSSSAICSGSSLSIGAASVSASTYSWISRPSGYTSTNSNPTVSPAGTTTYYLTETITATGCSKADSVTITVNPLPAATTGRNASICSGDSVYVGASAVSGNTYSWTSIPSGYTSAISNPVVAPSVTTLYFLTETVTATGCIKKDSINITVNPRPTTNITGSSFECSNSSGSYLTPNNSGSTYNWTAVNGTIIRGAGTDSVVVSWARPGSVALNVLETGAGGCKDSSSFVITVDSECVWPGDANYDKVVDASDILNIGLVYGYAGLMRPGATTSWYGQPCRNWRDTFSNGVNYKHADCNGDGSVNQSDTLAVSLNFSKTHLKSLVRTQGKPGDAPLNIVFTRDSLQSGDTLIADIMMGSSTVNAKNTYGISFNLNFNSNLIDTSIVNIDFNSCWFAPNGNKLHFQKTLFAQGQLVIVAVRTNHSDTTGFGRVCRIKMLVNSTLPAKGTYSPVTISNNTIINAKGNIIPVYMTDDSILVKQTFTGIVSSVNSIRRLNIFPNPFKGFTNIEYDLVNDQHIKAEVYDLLGRHIATLADENQSAGRHVLKFETTQPAGAYILRMQIGNEIIYKRIINL